MAEYFNAAMARHFNVYVECPTTGRTIDGMKGDDKVICNCKAAAERGGTHVVALCKTSTVERYMQERGYTDRQ
jgi:translation initiation factor 2 beta subunit (eIF-2beta)/eIF-5